MFACDMQERGIIMNGKQLAGTILGTVLKIAIAVIVVFYVYKAAAVAYDYGYRIFAEEPVSQEPGYDVTVAITSDKDTKDIGELLESRGLIRDSKLFVLQELMSEYHGKIREGAYTLNTSMTVEEMLEIMAAEEEETESSAEEDESSLSEETLTGEETTEEGSSEETP